MIWLGITIGVVLTLVAEFTAFSLVLRHIDRRPHSKAKETPMGYDD